MKLLLLLAFVGLAASASLRSWDFKANTPRELQYQYDAQIATGIEEVSNDFSTLRMRFHVIMRTDGSVDGETGAERWSLVFRTANLRQRNNATEQLPKNLLPMEQFRNIEQPDLWNQIERTLKKPFAVLIRPKELSIAKVLFDEEDPFWSVNIKKGFLSLLQVNFIPRDASSSTMEKGQWTKETEERTVAATCKTFYSANKIEFHESDSQVFRVDKAIDFNKCLNPIDGTWGTPGVWNGLRHVRMLPTEQRKNLVDVNNMAQYLVDMGSDRRTPTIRKASARTVHIVSPYSDSTHGSEKIFTVQKLRLITNSTSEESAPIDISGLTEQHEGIRLTYPQESKNVDREALKNKVVELFGNLFQTEASDIDSKTYENILRMLRFHLKKEEDLKSIAQQLATRFSDKHLKVFILDMCPQIGSHGAVKFLMQVVKMLAKITSPEDFVNRANLNIYHISVIFTKLSMLEKVQLKMLQTVFEVIRDEAFQNKLMNVDLMPIFSNAWLSTGAMVNVYYGKQGGVEPYMFPMKDNAEMARKYRYAPWEIRQSHAADSEQFRREFVQAVREWLQKRDMGRNLALKVTKNCGLFELYDHLAPIIRKRDTSQVTERVQAIYATQNMLRQNTLVRVTPEDARSVSQEQKYIRDNSESQRHFEQISQQIQADLITCFRNVREDPEVRIACYRVLMQCWNIKQTVLNMLIQSILSEPTQQVYSYCVRHMDQIAKNPLPRYCRVSQTVRSALSMLKRREPLDLVYSRVFHGRLWDELHRMGFTIETDMIVSDKSFTPRWTHIRVEHQGMGLNMPLLEVGLRTQGLQSLLEKLVGPRGLIYKVGGVMNLLRSRRSADASSIDSEELLNIVPRLMEELPNMDLTVAVMGYDVIYVKNTRNMADSVQKLNKSAMKKSLVSFAKFLQPFDGLFTISSNYELPTPAGTILDFTCLMTADVTPRIIPTVAKSSEGKTQVAFQAFLPITIQGFKRIGSNMHVLNHYHQWQTTLDANKRVYYEFSFKVDATNPQHIVVQHKLAAPSSKVPIVEFENTAYSSICESHFTGGRLSFRSLDKVIKHRKVADQREIDYSPVFSRVLAPFGYKIQVQGKYYSTRHLYQAPCTLFMGPSEYTIFMVPTVESSERSTIISSKLEIIYPTEESNAVPQIRLQINNVRASADESSETVQQKLVQATFTPKDMTAQRKTFDFELRWHLNLPSSYRTSGYKLKARGEIHMPEDLKMKPKSLPLKSEEWFSQRQLKLTIDVQDDESEVATIQMTKSTNEELKKLLVDSDLTEKDLKKAFPRLAACLNETKKSIKEEPLTANPLYTPSCIRQFKKFNKLSQTKIEVLRKASWFLSSKSSPMFDQVIQTIDYYLRPYLAHSEIPKMSDAENKITIVSRPSPVDMRVQHLNVTTQTRKNVWRSIQLPAVPFFWAGVDPLITAAADYVKGGASKCSLLHSHVRTFDNVIYSIPKSLFSNIAENQCPILLAKDCSPRKEFQVLSHIKDGKKYVTVHFNTDSKPFVIEVSKPIDSEQAKSIVKVNGAELEHSAEPKQEKQIMRRQINTEKGPLTIQISKYQYADTVMYKIESIEQGVQVLVGGPKLRKVEIRVSPFYRNKVCGLCGDYNAEKFREFKAPNYHQVMSSPKKMVQQYVLPISESCQMGQQSQEDADFQSSEEKMYLPSKIWYRSADMPSRRPSCQIVDNKKVKSFKHAEFKMVSPALKQIIRDTDCALKLAVAKINEHRIRVFLLPSQSKVLIQSGSFKQYLSTASPAINELSRDSVPAGLTADVSADAELAKFVIHKDDNRVTVKVTSDKRVIIKASEISQSEDAICELSHPSQIEAETSDMFSTLNKFTNAEESSVCRDQLKKKINQCHVSGSKVTPFYRASDYNRWQVRFLNAALKNRLAQTQAPIVLSVDQIGEESSAAHSVQLVHSLEADDSPVQHVLLKKNRQTLVKVSIPKSGSPRVTYTKDDSQHTVVPSASRTVDIDGDFALIVSNDRVQVSHKKNLYELEVQQLNSEKPQISIVRPYAHESYKAAGLCQLNRMPEVQQYRSNPQAVLKAVLESSLTALDSSAPILSEEEVGKISRQVGDFSDYYMLA